MKRLLLALALLILMSGCTAPTKTINPEEAASLILEKGTFETTFLKLDEDQIAGIYPEAKEVSDRFAVYESDSLEFEVIAVFSFTDENKAQTMLENRKESLLREAQNYFPEQVSRIENALLIKKENCLFLIIADDTQVIENLINDMK